MEQLFNILPTSRSAIETFRECKWKGFLNYFYGGTGIVPAKFNVPLSTGGCVHKGTEHLLRFLKRSNDDMSLPMTGQREACIEEAVEIGVKAYEEIVQGYWKEHPKTKEDEYTYKEQSALTEALIRAWGLVELPRLGRRFRVLDVELEETLPLDAWVGGKQIVDLARVDAILEQRDNKDWYNYSLKTQRSWYDVAEKRLKISLQNAIECMAVEYRLRQRKLAFRHAFNACLETGNRELAKSIKQEHDNTPKQLMGTKSCFLIKGDRKESKYEKGKWITYNPLIRGYRRNTPPAIGRAGKVEYAWSWFTVNPENKSGQGTLGKGWEPFNVWEEEFGVKGWIEKIQEGMQSDCGDPLLQTVLSPPEWFRKQQILDRVYRQISREEKRLFEDLKEHYGKDSIEEHFTMNQDACYPFINYPCEYLSICNNGNESFREHIMNDPVGSGEYVRRVAHHEIERKMLDGKA